MMLLENLPVELLIRIFSYIGMNDYLSLDKLNNKKIKSVLHDSYFLLNKAYKSQTRNRPYLDKIIYINENLFLDTYHGEYKEYDKDTQKIYTEGIYFYSIKVGEWNQFTYDETMTLTSRHQWTYNAYGEEHGIEVYETFFGNYPILERTPMVRGKKQGDYICYYKVPTDILFPHVI